MEEASLVALQAAIHELLPFPLAKDGDEGKRMGLQSVRSISDRRVVGNGLLLLGEQLVSLCCLKVYISDVGEYHNQAKKGRGRTGCGTGTDLLLSSTVDIVEYERLGCAFGRANGEQRTDERRSSVVQRAIEICPRISSMPASSTS